MVNTTGPLWLVSRRLDFEELLHSFIFLSFWVLSFQRTTPSHMVPFKGRPLTLLCDLEAGYGSVWTPIFGGAAPGFEPRTSCMRVRSRSHHTTGPAPHSFIIALLILNISPEHGCQQTLVLQLLYIKELSVYFCSVSVQTIQTSLLARKMKQHLYICCAYFYFVFTKWLKWSDIVVLAACIRNENNNDAVLTTHVFSVSNMKLDCTHGEAYLATQLRIP